jgi:hypothetical protein
VELSRHAKNELRLYGGTREEVETAVKNPFGKRFEDRGNPVYLGIVDGRLFQVVVAADDSNYVITVFPEGRG